MFFCNCPSASSLNCPAQFGQFVIVKLDHMRTDDFIADGRVDEIDSGIDAFCDDSGGRFMFHFSEIGDPEDLDAINFLEDERSKKAFQEDKKWLDW